MRTLVFALRSGARVEWDVGAPEFRVHHVDGSVTRHWEWFSFLGEDVYGNWSLSVEDRELIERIHRDGHFFANIREEGMVDHLMQHLLHFSHDDPGFGGTLFIQGRGVQATSWAEFIGRYA